MRPLIPALLLLAACNAAPQSDDESSLTIVRRPPPPRVVLSVQSLEPAQAVEGRTVVVHFTLDNLTNPTMNGRVRATISPVASAPFAGAFDWPVTNLGPGQSLSGVVAFVAPPAAEGNLLDLFFEDGTTHAQQNDVRQSLDVAGAYILGVDPIKQDNPRGLSNDNVAFGFAGQAGPDVGWSTFATDRLLRPGEQTNGAAGTLFSLLPNDTSSVAAALIVATESAGSDRATTIGNLASSLARDVVSVDSAAQGLFGTLCEGPLAVDRRIFTGRQLRDDIAAGTTVGNILGIEERVFYQTVHYTGFSSPGFCGGVSNYDVVWSVTSAFGPAFPDVAIKPSVGVTRGGHSVQFTAPFGTSVDWSVDGGAANGFIDANGLYTPPSRSLFNEQLTIRARVRGGSQQFVAYLTGASSGLVISH